jgi:hypothetical protein
MINKLLIIIIIIVIINKFFIKKTEKFSNLFKNAKVNKNTNEFNHLLQVWDNYCKKYGITYSIAFGTMLGHFRNKNYIPHDEDIDVWIGKKDIPKLLKIPEAFFTGDTHKEYNGCKLVIYKDHYKKMYNRKNRWNKYGKLVSTQVDPFAFNGPIGRVIINDRKFIDIFVFHQSSVEQIKKLKYDGWIEDSHGDLGDYNSSVCATDLPEVIPTKLNIVNTMVIKDSNRVINILTNYYGKSFYYPDKPYQ